MDILLSINDSTDKIKLLFAKTILDQAANKKSALLVDIKTSPLLPRLTLSKNPTLLLFAYLESVGISIIENHLVSFDVPTFIEDIYLNATHLTSLQLNEIRTHFPIDLIVASCLEHSSFPHPALFNWRRGLDTGNLNLLIIYRRYLKKVREKNPSKATKKAFIEASYKLVNDLINSSNWSDEDLDFLIKHDLRS